MSGRHRETLSPTLFPFLAVLVCTLGTLILLLAMVAQNAGDAVAASEPATPAPAEAAVEDAEALGQAVAQVGRRLREAQWYREQTVKMRDEQTAELEQRRDQLAHLEDHLQRLREQLRLLSTEIEQSLEQKGDAHAAQATLDQLLTQIEAEKEAIGNLEAELQSRTPRIVIVPHKGPNGTDRRPIYIQCRQDGVYLQPGGQRIERAQLEAATARANPLDAALRAIRLHAMQTYGDSVAPYPLLVVSPDGIETYALARGAMNAWDDQFGYELVPEGIELAFPAADPVLNDKVAAAIRQAVAQQETLALRGGGGSGSGYAAGQSRYGTQAGGAEANGSGRPAAAAPLPVLSAAQMSRGDRSGRTGYRAGSGAGAGLGHGDPSSTGETGAGTGANGSDAAALRDAAEEAGRRLEQQNRFAEDGLGSARSPLAAMPSADPQSAPSSGNEAQPGEATADSLAAAGGLPHTAGGSGDPSGNAAGSNEGQGSGQAGGSGSAVSSRAPGGTGGPQASGADAMAGSQDPTQNTSSGSPSVSFNPSATPPVTRVGKDWGLPSSLASSRGTEMLRMIRVECHGDRFVLLPEGGRGSATTFAFDDGDVDRASLALATAVRDRVSGWGAAMQGARWQPVLDVAVVRGGESRYQQLLRLMDGSGVLIQARGTR